MKWLLPQTEAERIRAIDEAVISAAATFAGLEVTSGPEPMSLSYGTAAIKVRGMLVKERDAILDYYGIAHTAYSEITAQVREAEDKGAKRGTIHFDSPGGQVVSDLYEAMDAIANSSIEWRATFGDLLASAAYMVASQVQKGIYATSEMSMAGSIGVAATVYTSTYRKDIANTDSPNKRPDANTEEGMSAIRDELDDIYGVLASKMATGRGVSVETIKNEYGKGAVMTARKAISMGVIDGMDSSYAGKKKKKPAASTDAAIHGGKKMDLNELKSEHPEAYRAAVAEGFEQGKAAILDSVKAHASLAKDSGLHAEALADACEGKQITQELMAKHFSAGMKKMQVEARGGEAPPPVSGEAKPEGNATSKASEEEASFNAAYAAKGFTLKIGA